MMKTKIYSIGVILVLLQISVSGDECKPDDRKCRCVYSDGNGFTLDGVVKDEEYLKAETAHNFTFFYHPCGDIKTIPDTEYPSNGTNVCKTDGYSLCGYNHTTQQFAVLGKNSDVAFVSKANSLDLIFNGKKVSISLTCTPQSESSYLIAPVDEKLQEPHLLLFTKSGCLKMINEPITHSFFYYFLFITFIGLFLYLAIGMTVNYIFVGARGFELIPNFDFWCKTWTTVKLGFAYVKNGCRVIPSEDSYDAI